MDIWGPSKRRFFGDKHWNEPILWNKQAEKEGKRKRVFCASMADVFEEFPGLYEQRSRLWQLIDRTPFLEWLGVTKRPENISSMIAENWFVKEPDNVRIGVTAEDQMNGNRRIPEFLAS